jgi:hypothetical protein
MLFHGLLWKEDIEYGVGGPAKEPFAMASYLEKASNLDFGHYLHWLYRLILMVHLGLKDHNTQMDPSVWNPVQDHRVLCYCDLILLTNL